MPIHQRIQHLNTLQGHPQGPVVYWMSRDQRVSDNWALLFASQEAGKWKVPLLVVFCLTDNFPEASARHYHFMIQGLKGVQQTLKELNIGFSLLVGNPENTLPEFIKHTKAGLLVTDFDPLRMKRIWKNRLTSVLRIPFLEIDTHNIVPCVEASQKLEFGAYTLRPKIKKRLPEFLNNFPVVEPQKKKAESDEPIDWDKVYGQLNINRKVTPVTHLVAGETEAFKQLLNFTGERLENYLINRNNPNIEGTSKLSPYLHFGQLSAQRVALEIIRCDAPNEAKEAFLEELIVRCELSDNFCYYNTFYDQFQSFPEWARKTLDEHRNDEREYIYSRIELEQAGTHDRLWNAAQKQMMATGFMHGYLRMYWAKKILEWSATPEQALQNAIALNDKYQLDGRDPNGYAGCAWSIGGVHDRAWAKRPVFGKIRFMNYAGCKRKFDTEKYISTFENFAIMQFI